MVDSQSVKTTAVGGEERGYDGGKKVKGRKRHLLVDTEGFVLQGQGPQRQGDGLRRASRRYCSEHGRAIPSPLVICGWTLATAERTRAQDWVEKTLGWSVDLVERPKKPAPEEVLMAWAAEWAKEGVALDWQQAHATRRLRSATS